MTDTKHVATFDSGAFKVTVSAMKSRGEDVREEARKIERKTGHLHPYVDVIDRNTGQGVDRVSRNALVKNEKGQAVLVNGVSLPIDSGFDGTGSMGIYVDKAFYAISEFYAMLTGIRNRYNPQISSSVFQDVCDAHFPFQKAQYESDNGMAEQLRMLMPDRYGGDETEDYDIGLLYQLLGTSFDINDFYGLKGYGFIMADQIGRGLVTPGVAREYLGRDIQEEMTTEHICQQLLKKMHLFYLQLKASRSDRQGYVTQWWLERLGAGRVVIVPNPDLLAEVQAGLVYVSETARPTQVGLTDFLFAGGQNKRISQSDASDVWEWLQDAKRHFGAQTRLPGYNYIPMPGDVFANYRDPWPIGHPLASENALLPGERPVLTPPPAAKPSTPRKKVDWGKF